MAARGQVADLEASILKVRGEQLALEHQRADAIEQEHRALAMVDAARAIQGRCDRLIEERADAIGTLQDEIAALIPKPRDGK